MYPSIIIYIWYHFYSKFFLSVFKNCYSVKTFMLAMSPSPVDKKIYLKCYVIWRTFHLPPTYLPITSIHSKNKLNIHRPAVFCGLCNGYHLFFNPSWLCNTNLWVTMIGLVIQESARHVPNPSRRWTAFSIKRKVTDDFWQLLTLMLKTKSPCSLSARDSGTRALCCPSPVWLLMCQGSLAG